MSQLPVFLARHLAPRRASRCYLVSSRPVPFPPHLVDATLVVSNCFNGLSEDEDVVQTEGGDASDDGSRDYVCGIVRPSDPYLENGRIDLFLQEDVESHHGEVAEVGGFVGARVV